MVCFAWSGFPQYAARCIGFLVSQMEEPICVVATRPMVPIQGMERLAGCKVFWLDQNETRTLGQIVGSIPRILFVSGWGIALFNAFRDQVRGNGGRVIALSDNNFVFSWKMLAKAIRFRLFLSRKYDGFMVPGKSCEKLLRFYGVPHKRIKLGMYSADEELFGVKDSAQKNRTKRILFVGQFCERKNPIRLCQAFVAANVKKEWILELYGSGSLRSELIKIAERHKGQIACHDFMQPEELAAIYRGSCAFCLPSLEEHWGLVVHEAALSGCVLLLSKDIGSGADFATCDNAILFDPLRVESMTKALRQLMGMTNEELKSASAASTRLGATINRQLFVNSVKSFL